MYSILDTCSAQYHGSDSVGACELPAGHGPDHEARFLDLPADDLSRACWHQESPMN